MPEPDLPQSDRGIKPARIIPKGLRCFDASDASFFLELLPGPRDRNGIPESLRQWKSRIEETDADDSFAIGLFYGPSGCGKSSFLRAGLLPLLAPHIESIYVEASPEDTESQLLKRLKKKIPDLPIEMGLAKCLASIRCGFGIASDHKLLLVIDQFEQWLSGRGEDERRSLVGPVSLFMSTVSLADRPELAFVDDQRGCPTFTADLAPAIRRLVASRLPGL